MAVQMKKLTGIARREQIIKEIVEILTSCTSTDSPRDTTLQTVKLLLTHTRTLDGDRSFKNMFCPRSMPPHMQRVIKTLSVPPVPATMQIKRMAHAATQVRKACKLK